MKRIWIFLMAMLCIVSFTGCDKTDEPNGHFLSPLSYYCDFVNIWIPRIC